MSLGEAFIEVRADMRPFIRDLDRQVRNAVRAVEEATNQAFTNEAGRAGDRAGDEAGRRASDRFRRHMRNSFFGGGQNNIFITIASSLAGALDDGISALPTEVKAAIVAGLILATPTIGAVLGAAIATGLGLGVAGLGILLASQFDQVQQHASDFGGRVRAALVTSADAFGPAIISSLDMIERKINSFLPVFNQIFDNAAKFLEPLTAGLLEGLGSFFESVNAAVAKLQPFIDTFSIGLSETLALIGDGLERLANTGEAGQQALRDLFFIVNALIGAFFGLIELLVYINQIFHRFLNFAMELAPVLAVIINILHDRVPSAEGALIVSNTQAADSFNGLVTSTNAQEKAARELIDTLDNLVDATYDNIQVDIDFERSLDRLSDSLEKNGKNLDIHTEKGRQNVEAFTRGLKDAEERALNRLRVQGYTSEQAAALYDEEIAQLRQVAREAGISDQKFNELFGAITDVSRARISSEEMGVEGLSGALSDASGNATSLLTFMQELQNIKLGRAFAGVLLGGFNTYADGDIVNRPTLGMFGENGPEVIIPLTKPARAAELAEKSGLTTIIGSNGNVIQVFIGNEQLESRVVRVVERSNRNQAQALTQGPRRF